MTLPWYFVVTLDQVLNVIKVKNSVNLSTTIFNMSLILQSLEFLEELLEMAASSLHEYVAA